LGALELRGNTTRKPVSNCRTKGSCWFEVAEQKEVVALLLQNKGKLLLCSYRTKGRRKKVWKTREKILKR